MRMTCLVFVFIVVFSHFGHAQAKWENVVLYQATFLLSQNDHVLFPNPSALGQDVFIDLEGSLDTDWWIVVTDVHGKVVNGVSTTQEGGRIRVRGQVPKPGIYVIRYGNIGYRSSIKWVVSE